MHGLGTGRRRMDPKHKPLEVRLRECVEIRAQLTRMGAMALDGNRSAVAAGMNAFLRDGTPSTFELPLGAAAGKRAVVTALRVQLSARGQSGVAALRC